MAKKKKSQQQKLASIVNRLARKFLPDQILHELSVVYEYYSTLGESEAEVEYWLKLSRAHGNLASGANKWLHEMIDEEEEKVEEGEEE